MVPSHWDFAEAQSRPIGEKKKFDIEREADGVRLFQNWPADIEPECFEPALRVPKWHSGREADDEVENAPRLLTPPRLMNANQVSIERARTKRKINIFIGDWLDYFVDFT